MMSHVTPLFSDRLETSAREQFREDVLRGLRAPSRRLPCKYLYDQTGSELFEAITQLDEYYLTRTELAIMQAHAEDMAGLMGSRCLLVEYGSGTSAKTRLLLDFLREPAGYVPIDISAEVLEAAAAEIAEEYPDLDVQPLCADVTGLSDLAVAFKNVHRKVVYFPGSTIGNFGPSEATDLFRRTAQLVGTGGGFLLGVDLQKDPRIIEAAYNDAEGITAAFNRNLLVRINRELEADFRPWQFEHHALYNTAHARIEMHLVSLVQQTVHVVGEAFAFQAGDAICTEYSYKFTLDILNRLAMVGQFALKRSWMDKQKFFAVLYFERMVGDGGGNLS